MYKTLLTLLLLFSFGTVQAAPGQFSMEGYITLSKADVGTNLQNVIYNKKGLLKEELLKFSESLISNLSKNEDKEYMELQLKGMLLSLSDESDRYKVLKEKTVNNKELLITLIPVIHSSESGGNKTQNPLSNDQGIFQLYSYRSTWKNGCQDSPLYTTCKEAPRLYEAGKSLSEKEYYFQLADLVYFLENKSKTSYNIMFGSGLKNIYSSTSSILSGVKVNYSQEEVKDIYSYFDKKKFDFDVTPRFEEYYEREEKSFRKIGVKDIDSFKIFFKNQIMAGISLGYNGFSFGNNYYDNGYTANVAGEYCFTQCANDGCTLTNTRVPSGNIYNSLIGQPEEQEIFKQTLRYLRVNNKLLRIGTCN